MPNPKQQNLQCPFCEAISTRGTGLSAHVRARHHKEYKNWNRNPNRLVEAAEAAVAPKGKQGGNRREAKPEVVEQMTSPMVAAPEPHEVNGNDSLMLLQTVHDQLAARKHDIEAEMARVEALRNEHESVTRQLAAVDQAMTAFRK